MESGGRGGWVLGVRERKCRKRLSCKIVYKREWYDRLRSGLSLKRGNEKQERRV